MIATTRSFFPSPYVSPFDRAFARLASFSTPVVTRSTSGPAVSGRWTDEGYRLTVDLPGVPQDAVGVSVAGRVLTVEVATDELSWKRQLRLPQTLDPEQVAAHYADGRLTVTVAKTAAPESRRIAIDTSPAAPALEASESAASAPADDGGTVEAESAENAQA